MEDTIPSLCWGGGIFGSMWIIRTITDFNLFGRTALIIAGFVVYFLVGYLRNKQMVDKVISSLQGKPATA